MVEAWFDTANEYIKQQDHGEDALQDPRRVWNMDETAKFDQFLFDMVQEMFMGLNKVTRCR